MLHNRQQAADAAQAQFAVWMRANPNPEPPILSLAVQDANRAGAALIRPGPFLHPTGNPAARAQLALDELQCSAVASSGAAELLAEHVQNIGSMWAEEEWQKKVQSTAGCFSFVHCTAGSARRSHCRQLLNCCPCAC